MNYIFNNRRIFLFGLVAIALLGAGVFGTRMYAEAVTPGVVKTNLKAAVRLTRYRMTFDDVKNGVNVGGNPSKKKVTLFVLAGADQILSMVSNVTTGFMATSTGYGVGAESVIAERNGVQVSVGNLMNPPNLSDPGFENNLANLQQYMFFDETESTDITVTVVSSDGTSLDTLTSGQVDFYVTKIE